MSKEKILIIEDELPMAVMMQETLVGENREIVRASTAAEGYQMAETLKPDLIVLDVGLPDESGLNVCNKIRGNAAIAATPIIILTARDKFQDKVSGFEAGADHYLVKPFQIRELHLWAQALLRRFRYQEQNNGILRIDDTVLDPQTHKIYVGNQVITTLTRKEFDLLYLMAANRPKTFTKEEIFTSLWGVTTMPPETIENHVKNLRSKLGLFAHRIVILPNVGYKFV